MLTYPVGIDNRYSTSRESIQTVHIVPRCFNYKASVDIMFPIIRVISILYRMPLMLSTAIPYDLFIVISLQNEFA